MILAVQEPARVTSISPYWIISCEACVMVRVLVSISSTLHSMRNMVMLEVKVMTNSKVRLPSRKWLEEF